MFSLFIVLLSFSISLATKYLFLNDGPCMVRPTLIDMNPNELEYYSFMISLNRSTKSCNVFPPKICFPKETKDINVMAFNMITNKDKVKAMTKHISCEFQCKFNTTTRNSKQRNNKTCQCECKILISAKKIIVRIVAPAFMKIVSILNLLLIVQ